ncbi:MAG: hypothetical protein ACLRZ7_13300 [Lachnospiraceae bacterium]
MENILLLQRNKYVRGIKFKIYPILSLLISALFIGYGAGMPIPTLVDTVKNGAGVYVLL